MRKSGFIEGQIIGMLKEHQARLGAAGLCRTQHQRCGLSQVGSRFGGMEASDAKRLRVLEDENAKLKRLLAGAMLDVSTLREVRGKSFRGRVRGGLP